MDFFENIVDNMPSELLKVIRRIQRRFLWVLDEIGKYSVLATERELIKMKRRIRANS